MSEKAKSKKCCYDCYEETLEKIPIVGPVYGESELGIVTVWICSHHKIKRLEDDIRWNEYYNEKTREKIAKVREKMNICYVCGSSMELDKLIGRWFCMKCVRPMEGTD